MISFGLCSKIWHPEEMIGSSGPAALLGHVRGLFLLYKKDKRKTAMIVCFLLFFPSPFPTDLILSSTEPSSKGIHIYSLNFLNHPSKLSKHKPPFYSPCSQGLPKKSVKKRQCTSHRVGARSGC